jgi:hypothetical protein
MCGLLVTRSFFCSLRVRCGKILFCIDKGLQGTTHSASITTKMSTNPGCNMSSRDEDVLDFIFNPTGLPKFQPHDEDDLGPMKQYTEDQRKVCL